MERAASSIVPSVADIDRSLRPGARFECGHRSGRGCPVVCWPGTATGRVTDGSDARERPPRRGPGRRGRDCWCRCGSSDSPCRPSSPACCSTRSTRPSSRRSPTLPLDGYQGYDKALDIYYLTHRLHLDAAELDQPRSPSRSPASCSTTAWSASSCSRSRQIRALLLIFPNTFEYFFDLLRGASGVRWDPRRMTAGCSSARRRSSGS